MTETGTWYRRGDNSSFSLKRPSTFSDRKNDSGQHAVETLGLVGGTPPHGEVAADRGGNRQEVCSRHRQAAAPRYRLKRETVCAASEVSSYCEASLTAWTYRTTAGYHGEDRKIRCVPRSAASPPARHCITVFLFQDLPASARCDDDGEGGLFLGPSFSSRHPTPTRPQHSSEPRPTRSRSPAGFGLFPTIRGTAPGTIGAA
jgi:hypothetical protein